MEEVSSDKIVEVKPKYSKKKIVRNSAILLLAFTLGYIHYKYVSVLYENVRHFSHLSELEREMSLRTEMGFYYSYYKTVVQERPFIAGISKLMYDRLVEYPKDVNAFNRFNIHPEVIIGALYRYLEPWLNTTAYKQCHMVDRGEGLWPIESCIGIGHPIVFYLEAVWVLAGLLASVIFLHATALSDSVLGGILAVTQYFANHNECTRVQWMPNERENFAAPLLFLQMGFLTLQLREREKKTCFQLQISIFILNCLCLLFWQFTQFIFLTQTAIFFVMEQLRIIDLKTLCVFLHSHFCGLHMAVLLLQGNDMLKSSLYASFFLVISAYCLFFSSFRIKVTTKTDLLVESWLVILRIAIAICTSVYLKQLISDILSVEDDTHIWELLYSKFSNYKTFHTLIYTCSEVFDFLPLTSVVNYTKTCLLPLVMFSCVNVVFFWMENGLKDAEAYRKGVKAESENKGEEKAESVIKEDTDDSGIENNAETFVKKKKRLDLDLLERVKVKNEEKKEVLKDNLIVFLKVLNVDPAIFYNISQMVVFGVMAGLIMRLKLLFGTQMCIVSSLIVNTKYEMRYQTWLTRLIFWALSASFLIQKLYDNITEEMSQVGEFSDVQQEELLEWISRETSSGAVFAGSMPILATVMLTTRRAIVAHPHYEHADARERVYAVYKMYGRFSPQELYQELTKLKATYLIVEKKYCYGRSRLGCSFQNIWDIEAPSYTGRPKLCHTLLTKPTDHLYRVFTNEEYAVFRVHDLSVRYMPRIFDT
ncbi:LOW QUALITY PROTEIN: probable C-mannosyltransferase DPY19L1 [Pectinophora gossypiella]|uniref:LOW QUALITY PROTEIN: probable C-mannosyltransferase DPY19L1 n=1 Tax=Pectinophora gossypiella TaxID=13191 RepID=UPI00214F23B7|nr:LOW QUALITY PROTEIN: probable C-mannosyltransferase DPY19L1 [Pectinophora gossypiella]